MALVSNPPPAWPPMATRAVAMVCPDCQGRLKLELHLHAGGRAWACTACHTLWWLVEVTHLLLVLTCIWARLDWADL